jgi:endoribonuclease Dicer
MPQTISNFNRTSMNKVWKKKWQAQLEHSDGHESSGGSGSSVPSLGSSEPVPPVNFQPTVPSALSVKRSQTDVSLDSSLAPPLKKAKTDALPTVDGSSGAKFVEPENASCNEVVLVYDKMCGQTETQLFRVILSLDPSENIFRRQLREARRVGVAVGMCAADLVWRRALKTINVDISLYPEDEDNNGPLEILNKTKAKIRDAIKNWAFTMPNLDPNSRGFNVTPKFLQLVQILKSCEPYGENFRGIVFGTIQISLRLYLPFSWVPFVI